MFGFVRQMFNIDAIDSGLAGLQSRMKKIARIREVMHIGLIIGAAVLIYVLGFTNQGQELFLILLEGDPFPSLQAIFAIGAALLQSGLLFFAYRVFLPHIGIDGSTDQSVLGSPSLYRLSDIFLYLVTLAPWIAATISIVLLGGRLEHTVSQLHPLLANCRPDELCKQVSALMALLDRDQHRITLEFFTVLFLGVATFVALRTIPKVRWLHQTLKIIVFILANVIAVGLGILPALLDWPLVQFYQTAGTLTAGLLAATGLFMVALWIVWVSRATGLAAYVTVIALVTIFVIGTWLRGQIEAPLEQWGRNSVPAAATTSPAPTLDVAIQEWVKAQPVNAPGEADLPLPMLIMSAEGGGTYAAAASGLVLARLHNSRFGSDHRLALDRSIFAVSSASGGSIGSALYQALQNHPFKCGKAGGQPGQRDVPTADKLRDILLDAHFAPLVGNVLPDIFRKIVGIFAHRRDRADALAESLAQDCKALNMPYDAVWSVGATHPALIFNTTWMSNGNRVAFAPFRLHSGQDETLWSFADVFGDADHGTVDPRKDGIPFAPTVGEAVVTSARFPGVLAPLSITARSPKAGEQRFNFGDGGYADGSGVNTAMVILDRARELVDSKALARPKIVPKLVMITFNYETVTPLNSPDTIFVETLSPIYAILGVRNNLADEAITRAQRLHPIRIALAPDEFNLPLGLQLSRTSFEILSLLLGSPDWCSDPPKGDQKPVLASILINSCGQQEILASVAQTTTPSPTAPAAN